VTPIDGGTLQQSLSSPPFFLLYGARCVGAEPASVPTYGEPGCGGARFSETFYEYEVPKPHNVLVVIEVADSTPGSNHTQCFDRRVLLIYAEAGVPEFDHQLGPRPNRCTSSRRAQTTGSRTSCL